jgi:hypothetical protein
MTKFTPVIKNGAPFRASEAPYCQFTQLVPNMIENGKFTINFKRVNGEDDDYCAFGIKVTAQYDSTVAYYWDGSAWTTTRSFFACKSGKEISTESCPISFVYVTLMVGGWTGDTIADMSDLELIFSRKQVEGRLFNTGNREENVYTAKNNAVVRDEWSESTMFCSDNYCKFGPGVIINPNNTYFKGWDYAQHSNASSIPAKQPGYNPIVLASPSQPEQHLVNRIVKYWSQSRRKIECSLLSNLVSTLSPRCKVTIDGSTMYPVSFARNWRDDVLKVTLYEV